MRAATSRSARAVAATLVLCGLVAVGFPTEAAAKEVSAEKWVKSVCTSLDDWAESLAGAQDDPDLSATDLADRKDALVGYLEEVTDATSTLLRRLKKAGTPDVDDGKAVAGTFRKGFTQARDTFADAADQAAGLAIDDEAQFEEDVTDLRDAINEGAEAISETFDDADQKYEVQELDDAFDEEPACSGIA